ncbi:MAG TPA: trypsin-like peptidase domain-containing protein [Clostridia bacterium]|nr:trypsin-like peptidase domain-containing protein [Clostridia bacterium]
MDNFDNFYNGDNNNDEKKKDDYVAESENEPRIIFQNNEPTPEPKNKKAKKTNTVLTIITIILVLAFIVNIVVLSVLKDEIATKFANNMSYQAQSEYKTAIDNALNNTGIVDDVKSAATNEAINRLSTDIGENVAAASIDSVVIINCTATNNTSTATGFLINKYGTRYILTNEHVVMYETTVQTGGLGGGYLTKQKVAYTNISCKFYDSNTNYNLTLVAHDEDADLALLKFSSATPSAAQHPALKFAASPNTLKYGEEVLLIGNPEGIGIAVTKGTVSIPSLAVESWGTGNFVMTDAAVNPGNSGGPMLDRNGVCVGVVESKLVSSNIDNMGFAVAIDTVINFLIEVEDLLNITIGYMFA